MKITAKEFAESIEFPCFFFVSVGSPGGATIAILPETELPVNLCEVTGVVDFEAEVFECDNYTDGDGREFTDVRGNTIYKIQIVSDKKFWAQSMVNRWRSC